MTRASCISTTSLKDLCADAILQHEIKYDDPREVVQDCIEYVDECKHRAQYAVVMCQLREAITHPGRVWIGYLFATLPNKDDVKIADMYRERGPTWEYDSEYSPIGFANRIGWSEHTIRAMFGGSHRYRMYKYNKVVHPQFLAGFKHRGKTQDAFFKADVRVVYNTIAHPLQHPE